jgi:hypothetical protein
MHKNVALAISICAAMLAASGGPAQSGPLSIKKFDNRPSSLITPVIEGKQCLICTNYSCTGPDLSTCRCEKWEEVPCGDIVVKNMSGKGVYVNRTTGKPVWMKGMRAPAGLSLTPRAR